MTLQHLYLILINEPNFFHFYRGGGNRKENNNDSRRSNRRSKVPHKMKEYNLNINRTKSKTYTQINRNKHIIRQRLQLSLKSIYHFVLARGQPIKDKSSKAVVLRRGMTCMIGGCGNPDFKQGTNSTLFYGKNQRHTYWSANKRKTENLHRRLKKESYGLRC